MVLHIFIYLHNLQKQFQKYKCQKINGIFMKDKDLQNMKGLNHFMSE